MSLSSSPAGSLAAEAPQPSPQALLGQLQDPAGLSTQPRPGATACAVVMELSVWHDRVHVTLTPTNVQPQTADSALLVAQSAAATTRGTIPNAESHAPSSALHGAARTEKPCPVSSPEADQAAVAMDGQPCDVWQSDDGADVAADMQTVRAQDVAAGNAGVLQGPPLLDTQVCTSGNAAHWSQHMCNMCKVCRWSFVTLPVGERLVGCTDTSGVVVSSISCSGCWQ